MATEYKINEPTQEIQKWRKRWAKNRAFADGEDAVKAHGETYLPKTRCDDSAAEYQAHKDRTHFLPAVNKIEQGLSGLIRRKKASFSANSAMVTLLTQLISADGKSMVLLAAWLIRETMITNFTGLLNDHPDASQFENLTAANAIRKGFRPYVNGYAAETILEITQGIVGTAVALVHVRLLERDGTRVRQLLLEDDGFYEVRIYDKASEGGEFVLSEVYQPVIDGQRLTYIPFELVNTHSSTTPTPAMLEPCVDLNLQHYRTEGMLAAVMSLTQAPIVMVRGFEREKDSAGNEVNPNWDVSAGAVWEFKDKDVEVDYHVYDPKGAELIINKLKDLWQALSTLGHSMIAPEKAAPDATAVHLLRNAAENATLVTFTQAVSKYLEKSFQRFAQWADPKNPGLSYSLNVDFDPMALSSSEHKELRDDWQAGAITHRTYLQALKDGEVYPEIDIEAEIDAVAQEQADRPTLEI